MTRPNRKIVIMGAGPTGLGAALRLKEIGINNFIAYERNGYPGGISASFKDENGFTWDLGGHVIFSRYPYVNKLLDRLLKHELLEHKRSAWIYTKGAWIPYPFQKNIRYLPKKIYTECLKGIQHCRKTKKSSDNFLDWVLNNLGNGIAKYFMLPYNFKSWAYSLDRLSVEWLEERVSVAIIKDKGKEWGANAVFRYPVRGGIGALCEKVYSQVKDNVKLKKEVTKVDVKNRILYFSSGEKDSYDILINTSPLDTFLRAMVNADRRIIKKSAALKHNSLLVVGIGVNSVPPNKKISWVYFPEKRYPFFRITYLSNYSPYNTPNGRRFYSILCETAYMEHKKEKKTGIISATINGLIDSGILKSSDRKYIVSRFFHDIKYAYPVPTLDRKKALHFIQPELEKLGIYSRGRFGAWKYEIGNMDHSLMQGKEIADRIAFGTEEKVWR